MMTGAGRSDSAKGREGGARSLYDMACALNWSGGKYEKGLQSVD